MAELTADSFRAVEVVERRAGNGITRVKLEGPSLSHSGMFNRLPLGGNGDFWSHSECSEAARAESRGGEGGAARTRWGISPVLHEVGHGC